MLDNYGYVYWLTIRREPIRLKIAMLINTKACVAVKAIAKLFDINLLPGDLGWL